MCVVPLAMTGGDASVTERRGDFRQFRAVPTRRVH